MAISTLNEYYSSKGQALPSVSERQGMAAQAGIQNYTGTAQQNTQLLSSLMSNQGNQTAVPNTTIPAPVAVGTTTPVNLPKHYHNHDHQNYKKCCYPTFLLSSCYAETPHQELTNRQRI